VLKHVRPAQTCLPERGGDFESSPDLAIHNGGVQLAGRRGPGGKAIQKALDARHAAALKPFSKVTDSAGLKALWEDAKVTGDIPDAYWAIMTHAAAETELAKSAFADVHMLSHLVGAANRADIRRLNQLERDKSQLEAKVERQQVRMRDAFQERDTLLRRLNTLLIERADDPQRGATLGNVARRMKSRDCARWCSS
jgi:hypothetical protein